MSIHEKWTTWTNLSQVNMHLVWICRKIYPFIWMFNYYMNYFCSFSSLFLSVNKCFELYILFGSSLTCLLGLYHCREHPCRISHRVYPKRKDTLCWPSSKEYNPFGLWCIWCTTTCEQVEFGTDHVPLHQWLHCSGNLVRPVCHSHWIFYLFFKKMYILWWKI